MKEYANLSMQRLADLIGLQTPHGRTAVNNSTVYAGTHLLQVPVRLFILLHFYADSNTGTAESLDPAQLAEKLGCNVRSVRAALERLSADGFISLTAEKGCDFVTIQITDILSMYKRRGEGGRGYVTVNASLRDELVSMRSINMLRVSLRALIETATRELTGSAKQAVAQIGMASFRTGLPKYVKPCVIREVLSNTEEFSHIFDCVKSGRHSVVLRLRNEYNGQHTKLQMRAAARDYFRTMTNGLNSAIRNANRVILTENRIPVTAFTEFMNHGLTLTELSLMDRQTELPVLDFNARTIEDLSVIAQDYGIDGVAGAVRIYYEQYLLKNVPPDKNRSIGSLIRSITEELFINGTFTHSAA